MYAAYLAKKEGHTIDYLLNVRSANEHSYMFQHVNVWITEEIAKVLGIPILVAHTKGVKEEELADLEELLKRVAGKVDGIVTGALASNYQYTRIVEICGRLGLKGYNPLWKVDEKEYWPLLLRDGFEVMVTAVAAEGLTQKWLGRVVDGRAVEELKAIKERTGIHMGFEGGEAESLVIACPLYNGKRIRVLEAEKKWFGDSGVYEIRRMEWV